MGALGGKIRKFANEDEKARKRIGNTIANAYKPLGDDLSHLRAHLESTLRVTICAVIYSPKPNIPWEF